MYEVDLCLTGKRYRTIIREISHGIFDELNKFLKEYEALCEEDCSDSFVHKMQTLLRLLIDVKAYNIVAEIIDMSSILLTYEDTANEGEECVLSYAIKNIEDDNIIARFLEKYDGGILSLYMLEFEQPSCIAVDQERYNLLELLFEKGLCEEVSAYGRWTLLQHAARTRNYELATFVLEQLHHNPDLYGVYDIPPLCLAANENDFRMVQLLLEHGADASITDGSGKTAINYSRSDRMIKIFESFGAKRENLQLRLVGKAVSDIKNNGKILPDVLRHILNYENPVFSNSKYNLILLCAKYGDIESLKCLKPYLYSVDAEKLIVDAFSWYELDDVVQRKSFDELLEISEILIDAGVSISNKRKSTLSPYNSLNSRPEMFVHIQQNEVFRLFNNLKKLGYLTTDLDVLGYSVFHSAIKSLNIPLINYCLNKGMRYRDLDTYNAIAVSLLLSDNPSCREFKESNLSLLEQLLQQLIENGCDINHQDKYGETVLHKLAKDYLPKAYSFKLAIKYGADKSLKNNAGETAYDIGLQNYIPSHLLSLLS